MSNTKTIDWNKPIQTTTGLPARLLGTLKGNSPNPQAVAVDMGGYERVYYVTLGGSGMVDIINVPPPGKDWTPVSTPPTNCVTVLVTDCPAENLEHIFLSPRKCIDCVWTAFYSVSPGVWSHNRLDSSRYGPPTFWRNLP